MNSLKARLLLVLSVSVLLAWIATAFFTYLDTRREIGLMLDDQMRQTGLLILGMVDDGGAALAAHAGAGGQGGPQLAYRVLAADGRVVAASPGAPWQGWSGVPREGFGEIADAGRRWRVLALADAERGLLAQVAQPSHIREAIAGSVASHLMHPLVVAVPVLGVILWMSVNWGLAPLQALAREVKNRQPASLQPVEAGEAPVEARPLVAALNSLFARVMTLIEKERRFTADAAHELRTPLAAIRTHAQVALSSRDAEESREALQSVVKGTGRAAHLVEQLLILARLDPDDAVPSSCPVPLAEVARAVIADEAPSAAMKGLDISLTDGGGEGAAVAGNADLLAVMLRNLIDNAVRYTPAGGRVSVDVRKTDHGVELAVSDTGPGIPDAQRGRVLERFYRVLGTGEEGSGLGLSIVAGIARLHGAELALDEGMGGRGLCVRATFPAIPGNRI